MDNRDFIWGRAVIFELAGMEVSEIGGDGGVGASDVIDEADLASGVARTGEDVVVPAECSETGDCGRAIPGPRTVGFLTWRFDPAPTWCSLSCIISASTLRSDNSSRSRCVSILRASLSCSPSLISSSSMTARSMATLYFDSRSSSDEVVFLACRSKSSFATSISRSFN